MTDRTSRPDTTGPDSGPEPPFPVRLGGEIITGFGRGSKDLGIPTANIPVEELPKEFENGIYYGWAGIRSKDTGTKSEGGDDVYPMVMSVGENPFYKNEKKSMEVHIIHKFPGDFYGAHLNIVVLGYIRPEFDYVSKEALIEDIMKDIDVARKSLERPPYTQLRQDAFLTTFP